MNSLFPKYSGGVADATGAEPPTPFNKKDTSNG